MLPLASLAVACATGAGAADPAGMRAYVDPHTGAIAPPPAEAVPHADEQTTTAPPPDLVEEPAPGGGTMVHLHGRFTSPLVVTVQPGGGMTVGHAPATDARNAR